MLEVTVKVCSSLLIPKIKTNKTYAIKRNDKSAISTRKKYQRKIDFML